jgi:hypothetical protein
MDLLYPAKWLLGAAIKKTPQFQEAVSSAQDWRRTLEQFWDFVGGTTTRDLPDDERERAATNAYAAWRDNPMAAGFINTMNYFMTRPGFAIDHPDDDVRALIDEYIIEDRFVFTLKQMINRSLMFGEVFPVMFANTITGDVKVREIEPGEIEQVVTDPDDYYKIDALYRKFTRREWDYQTNRFSDEDFVEYIRYNENVGNYTMRSFLYWKRPVLSNVTRGISYLSPVLWDLAQYKEIKRNRAVLHRARAAIAWFVTVKAATSEELSALKGEIKERGAPNPGSVVVNSEAIQWDAKGPDTRGADAQYDLRELGLQVCAGTSMPEFIVRGDASNANYASNAITFDAFKVVCQAGFGVWDFNIVELFAWILDRWADARRVSPEAAREPVQVIWPDLPQDQAAFNEMLNSAHDRGVISDKTYVNYLPLDVTWDEERIRLEEQEKEKVGGIPLKDGVTPLERQPELETAGAGRL